MIRSCPIYSIKRNGAYCAPFVALDSSQALQIVCDAIIDVPATDMEDTELWRIGMLDFIDGISNCDQIRVATAIQLLEKRDADKEEGEVDGISETV